MSSGNYFKELLSEFHPRHLVPSIAAAMVVASIQVVLAISFGAFIFSGPLKANLTTGISLMLLSTVIMALFFSLFSRIRGMIGGLQDTMIAVLVVIAMTIAISPKDYTAHQLLITIVALIAVTSIITGVALYVLGSLKMGKLVRYLPYPVIGGFIAGSGWLLSVGTVSMLTDVSVSMETMPLILVSDQLIKWVPGVVFGFILYIVTRKFDHYLVVPGLMMVAIIFFYIFNGFGSENISIAVERGLLFKTDTSTSFFEPILFHELIHADFGSIFSDFTSIVGVVVIGIITFLLCVTGIELNLKQDIDLNYELKLAGVANIFSGLFGGMAGMPLLSQTTLVNKIKASTRLTGIFFAIITASVMFFGAQIITVLPKFVLGGLLIFLGLSFLIEWLVLSFKKFTLTEYLIIVLIVACIANIGFLEGVIIGIFLSVIYFVVRYSKISIIRHEVTGLQMRSTVQRPAGHWEILENSDITATVLKLQAFLFFGTANNLLEKARDLIDNGDRFVILDFHRVLGFDSSAALSFLKLMQIASTKGRSIAFCCLNANTHKAFENSGFHFNEFDCLHVYDDLDHALEWYEESVLKDAGLDAEVSDSGILKEFEASGMSREEINILLSFTERCTVEPGDVLIKQGDTTRDLYYVSKGRMTVALETDNGRSIRVSTLNPGVFFGEMCYYLKQTRSASIIADVPSELSMLSAESLAHIEKEYPKIAVSFHTWMAKSLSERLKHTDDTLRSMLI